MVAVEAETEVVVVEFQVMVVVVVVDVEVAAVVPGWNSQRRNTGLALVKRCAVRK